MFFVCSVSNTNPSLGPVKGDQQSISVYDRNLGNRRTLISTPEEIDDFVSERSSVLKSARKNGLAIGLSTLAGCTAAGAGIAAALKSNKINKLNELVPELNSTLTNILKNSKEKFPSAFKAKDEAIEIMSKKYSELKQSIKTDLFNFNKERFVKINKNNAVKDAAAEGALLGMVLGSLGLFAPACMEESADKKITDRFIRNNI